MASISGVSASLLALFFLFFGKVTYGQNSSFDVFQFVDPFVGTLAGGHVFPGASLPFSMAKAVADTDSPNDLQGGFASDNSTITGFSHMHDTGTGGSPSLGNFPIFPQAGCPQDSLNECKFKKDQRAVSRINGTAVAHPGYFAITLNTSVHAEMTVTNHTALYRFTFPDVPVEPAGSNTTSVLSPLMLLDLTDLPDFRINGSASVDPKSGRIIASGTFKPSFGIGTYDLHACADFSGADIRDTGVWAATRAGSEPKNIVMLKDGNQPPSPAGAWTRFNKPTSKNQLISRVGMSFISPAQACSNAEKEIPDFDFDGTLAAAEDAWRKELGVVEVNASGVNNSLQITFWSAVYRALLSPQDYTGENPLWNSSAPYYDSYYCIWDTFRGVHQMITVLDPVSQTRMVQSLIDIYVHEGKLPDCRMSLCKGFTQGGSNADVVLADSFVKGIEADWETAYEGMVSDAELEPLNWNVQGRGGLTSWKNLGYIPTEDFDPFGTGNYMKSVSRTVEYAYDDFSLSLVAAGLNKTADHEKYLERSGNWKNMFKADQTSFINQTDTGFVGFLQQKYLNGTFGSQEPTLCSPANNFNFSLCPETDEGSLWMYTFWAFQDMEALISMTGGPRTFVARLDYYHDHDIAYIGNEQALITPFLYHYAGRPALSTKRTHFYIPSMFNATVNGLPGNDDSGAMASFVFWSMLGVYPVYGQNVYLILAPFFESVSVKNPITGNTATIKSINFDPGYQNIFIQSATLNNQTYTKNWLTHEFFSEGGTLELVLGNNESSWGTHAQDLPPSFPSSGKTEKRASFDGHFQWGGPPGQVVDIPTYQAL